MLLRKKIRKLKQISVINQNGEHNIHKSFRFILVIAQIFGFFPFQGVLKEDVSKLSFTWFSLRVLSSILTITGGTLIILGHIRHIVVGGYEQFEMNGVVFHFSGTMSCILFLKLATEWHDIMAKWHEVDLTMSSYGWPKNLNKRLKVIAAIFLLCQTADHLSIQTNKLIVAIQCKGSLSKGFEHFCVNMSFSAIFDVVKPFYSPYVGLLLQLVNTRMAFSWTFLDLFIILISCALALRFRQINYRVRCLRDMKVHSERSWISVNEDYNRLCKFCDFLDDKVSWLILVSFFNNFYFIIFSIFDSLNLHKATTLETIYYFISLSLLILRLVSICLYGSWIHEESKAALDLLSTLSYEVYNKEVVRFMDSIKYQAVGLTGKKIFRITRKLVLKIASAVVTYELIVIQFKDNSPRSETPSKNSLC